MGRTSTPESLSIPEIASVPIRTLHGPLSTGNHHSLEWSWNGLLAFGCQKNVIVAESREPLRVVQTLEKHKHCVNRVKWPQDNSLRLASSDLKGSIIVWDVVEGSILSLIVGDSKEPRTLLDMKWIKVDIPNKQVSPNHCLLTLYSNNSLVIYDTEFGEIAWKKPLATGNSVDYKAVSLSVDPFSSKNLVLALNTSSAANVECSFLLVEDLVETNWKLKRFQVYVTNNDNQRDNSPLKSPRLQLAIQYMASTLSRGDNEGTLVSHYLLECKQIVHHKSCRDQIILIFCREIVIVDLTIFQVICIIPLERNSSNIVELYPCRQRNVLLTLHESGNIIVRLFQKNVRFEDHLETNVVEVSYISLCHSEGIRLTKQNRIVGFSVSPVDETRVSLLLNNGRLLIKQLQNRTFEGQGVITLSDLITVGNYNNYTKKDAGKNLRLIQSQMMGSLCNAPHVIRTCPPVTKYNWRFHRPLLAVGDSIGTVQVFNLATGYLEKEMSVHSSPVRGIEWVSLGAFLSYGYPNLPRNSGRITNELFLTDINSGRSDPLRVERNAESSPIEMLKVSHLKQYFILTFKNEPFEIWDLRSLSLLRVMPRHFSSVTAVEWSPLYNKRSRTISGTRLPGEEGREGSTSPPDTKVSKIKENFVVTNTNGDLYHFSVEGTTTKEVSCIPPDAAHGSGNITSIAWKADQVVLGDADGNLHYWDLKRKQSNSKASHRGWIKKVRFGPGRGNMKCLVLYNDGIELWDIMDMSVQAEIKSPRDVTFKIQDIDWAGSDRPVLSTSEGLILVTDFRLKYFASSISLIGEKSRLNSSRIEETNLHFQTPSLRFVTISTYLHDKEDKTLPESTLMRNLEVGKLLGDREAITFWQLVDHHMDSSSILQVDSNFEYFLNNLSFREIQKERVALYELKRNKHDHSEKCCEFHLLLGNHQRAVQLLLETDSTSKDKYYRDALKACLIASLQASSEENDTSAHPVVKLVATSLIASGAIDEGVQLLYLIGKVPDACRYLQSNGFWEKSVWVAKTNLPEEESLEFIKRWSDHLVSQNERDNELFALLSMRNYPKVLEVLCSRDDLQKAALFADVCLENNVLPADCTIVDHVYSKYSDKLEERGLHNIADDYRKKTSQPKE